MSDVYYNECDEFVVEWLRQLISAKQIPDGCIDSRSILDVTPDDLKGFTQCHFFAGIGVWAYAMRKAGWPDDRELWTGSCPCQPFSASGKGLGFDDERHLWPAWFWLIDQRRPASKGVRSPEGALREVLRRKGPDLAAVVVLASWPTPTTRDHKDGTAQSCQNVPVNALLGRAVHLASGPTQTGSTAAMKNTGQLNPAHSRW